MIPTVVIRHPKERMSKCSLRPLHGRENITFHKAKEGFQFDATNYTLLCVDAPILSEADAERPLLLLDSTWRLLPKLESHLYGEPIRRSLPPAKTAYPRITKMDDHEDPDAGLASVEALYLAQKLLGYDEPSLLNGYHWREDFLKNLQNL